jgi:hypothetical protein
LGHSLLVCGLGVLLKATCQLGLGEALAVDLRAGILEGDSHRHLAGSPLF